MLVIKNAIDWFLIEAKKLPLMIWFYICGIGLLTLFLSFITPPFKGIDEPAHFFRALQVSEGHLLATKYADNVYGGNNNSKMSIYCSYMVNNKVIDSKTIHDFNRISENETVKNIFSTSATYSPIMYISLAGGLFLGKTLGVSVENRYVLGKLCNIITYTFLLSLAVIILPYGRYFVLLFFSTPSILQMTAYYNADTFTNLLALLFVACCFRVQAIEKNDADIWKYTILFLALILGCLKVTYCFFSLLVLLIPANLFKSKSQYFLFVIMTVVLSVLPAVTWNYFYKFTPGSSFNMHNDPVASLQMVKHHPFVVIKLAIHSFQEFALTWSYDIYNRFVNGNGNLFVITGYSRYVFTILLLFTFFVEKKPFKSVAKTIFTILLSILYSLLVAVAFYIGFSTVDGSIIYGMQIRYFILPMIMLILAIMCFFPQNFLFKRMVNTLLILNFICVLYVVVKAVPQIIS